MTVSNPACPAMGAGFNRA